MIVLSDARAAVAAAVATSRARPFVLLLILVVLVGSNLLRFWLAGAQGGSAAAVARAVGGVFLVVRACVTLWLHVAVMRIMFDPAMPRHRAFDVDATQAGWFHLLALAAIGTSLLRGVISQATGGADAVGLAVGFAISYAVFLPLQPGFARVLLRNRPTPLGWSMRAIRGQYLRAFAAVMLIAYPPALLRRALGAGLRTDLASSVALTAVLDALLSLVLMLLATAIYLQCFHRAEARDAGASGVRGAISVARARGGGSPRR